MRRLSAALVALAIATAACGGPSDSLACTNLEGVARDLSRGDIDTHDQLASRLQSVLDSTPADSDLNDPLQDSLNAAENQRLGLVPAIIDPPAQTCVEAGHSDA